MVALNLLALPDARAVPLEVYGRLPSIEEVALSPAGTRIAVVRTEGDSRILAVVSLSNHQVLGGLHIGEAKLRSIQWADEEHLLIETSTYRHAQGLLGGKEEWWTLQVYDVDTHQTSTIPDQTTIDSVMNVLAGSVAIRHVGGHTVLYVPGLYVAEYSLPVGIHVDLSTKSEKLVFKGSRVTSDWLVDDSGEVTVVETYDEEQQRWGVSIRRDGQLQEVLNGQAALDEPSLIGFGPSPDSALVQVLDDGEFVWKPLSLKDGSLGSPDAQFQRFDRPLIDRLTGRVIGGVRVEDDNQYQFLDTVFQHRWDAIVRAFRGEHLQLVSTSADFNKIVVRVDGAIDGLQYKIIDMQTHRADPLGDVYDGITVPLETQRLTYSARDDLSIPAYLTLPRGRAPKNLPAVVLVHGGPESRDTADFDWWAQALAEQGYAVLQVNFRGSSLSQHFIHAGYGEFGRKMQSDLSDGVRYLSAQGIIDPKRVCIEGASYGGYAALAGVTLQHGIYRCAISVAGLSDLRRQLGWGSTAAPFISRLSETERYWDRFMGVTGPMDPVLADLSPIKHVDAVDVPVLLVHGWDDTVVPFEQSDLMYNALRRAHKDVQLVALHKEDHWLSRSDTRLQMLEASVEFLRLHNPPD